MKWIKRLTGDRWVKKFYTTPYKKDLLRDLEKTVLFQR